MKKLIGALALAAACGTVQADPVDSGIWYGIGWSGGVGSALTGSSVVGTDPGSAPWSITIGSGGATLTVVDMFASGDRFSVFNLLGVPLGETSAVPTSGGNCGSDFAACLASPLQSQGAFALSPGNYALYMELLQSAFDSTTGQPFGGGSAAFRIDLPGATVIPLPPAAALLLSGLAGLGWFGRRKRS